MGNFSKKQLLQINQQLTGENEELRNQIVLLKAHKDALINFLMDKFQPDQRLAIVSVLNSMLSVVTQTVNNLLNSNKELARKEMITKMLNEALSNIKINVSDDGKGK